MKLLQLKPRSAVILVCVSSSPARQPKSLSRQAVSKGHERVSVIGGMALIRHCFAFSIAHRSGHFGAANRPRRIGATAYERGRLSWWPLSFQTKCAMSALGTSRHFAAPQNLVVIGGIADIRPGSPASMTLGNMRQNGVRTLAA
jgi:hypothetical protein